MQHYRTNIATVWDDGHTIISDDRNSIDRLVSAAYDTKESVDNYLQSYEGENLLSMLSKSYDSVKGTIKGYGAYLSDSISGMANLAHKTINLNVDKIYDNALQLIDKLTDTNINSYDLRENTIAHELVHLLKNTGSEKEVNSTLKNLYIKLYKTAIKDGNECAASKYKALSLYNAWREEHMDYDNNVIEKAIEDGNYELANKLMDESDENLDKNTDSNDSKNDNSESSDTKQE